MKNLKKILIALAVLALLISSVAVLVVTADDEVQYTGDLAKARELLDDVPSMDRTDSTTDLRKEAIKKVYNYVRQYPIDPTTEGYAEFRADWYNMSLMIANKYYDKLAAATSKSAKEKQLKSVYDYLIAFPIPEGTPDPDGDGTEYISYDELFASLEGINFGMMQGYYDSAVSGLEAGNLDTAKTNVTNLYTHVSKWPLLKPEVHNFDEFYANYNDLALRITESYIADFAVAKEEAEMTGDNSDYKALMQSNLSIIRDHMEKCPVDTETLPELNDRYLALTPAMNVIELDQIVFLFEDFKNFEPGAATATYYPELDKAASLAKVSKALSDSSVPEDTEGYAELVAAIAEAEVELAQVKEQRRLALDSQSKLYEYALTNNMSYKTFSSDSETMGNPNADAGEYSERIKTYDNGMSSGYEAYWRYTYSTGREGNTNYASLTQPNILNGYVHSFDMMVEGRNGQHFKGATFSNEWTGKSSSDRLVGYEGTEFSLAYDADTDSLKVSTGNGISPAITVKNIAAEGQWFNVMIVYDPVTHYADLYIDYQHVFTFFFNGWVENAKGMVIRISHSADWQYVCYDNIRFYEGTAYRDVDKFDAMTAKEQFDFYANYLLDDSNPDFKSRNTAYVNAVALIEQMRAEIEGGELSSDEAEALTNLISAVEAFDYETKIVTSLRAENLAEIINRANSIGRVELPEEPADHECTDEDQDGLCDNADCGKPMVAPVVPDPDKYVISVSSDKINNINTEITNFESFIAENNDFIDKADPYYVLSVQMVNEVKAAIVKLENAKNFATALVQFERATTVASMTRRALAAEEIYKAERYDKAENRDFVINDPLFDAIEAIINKDVQGEPLTVFDYYAMIPEIIAEQQKVENSVRIIKCVELLLQIEGYEDTEEFWLANYDELDFYMTIIRDIVNADNYDPTYPGIDDAMAQFDIIDAFFFVLLQEEHKAIIGAQLDRFAESSSYIEKIGICTYLDRYFASNTDIDLTLPEIQEFVYRLERYKAELDIYKDDYVQLLERNTRYFIDTINKMRAYTTYADLKPLYDEALSYYYAMNADTAEARAAVALFDEYDKALTSIETNSELFLNVAMNLDLLAYVGVDSEFMILSECSFYYDYIDVTYSSALESRVESYEALAAEYNGIVETANQAVETALGFVCSVRSEQIPVSILAVINQLSKN